MAEIKTQATDASVAAFLDGIEDAGRREDCRIIAEVMQQASGAAPKMWGDSIVGFGDLHYHYASGREGDWFKLGFSPRKQNLTLYLSGGLEKYADLLERFGKHKTGKGCIYIKRLSDVDAAVLRELVDRAVK